MNVNKPWCNHTGCKCGDVLKRLKDAGFRGEIAIAAISTAVTRADAMTVEKAARDLTLLLDTAPPAPRAAH